MLNIPLKGVNRKGFKPSREEKNPLPPTPPQRIKGQKETDFLSWYKPINGLHRLILERMVFLSRLQHQRDGNFYCYPGLDYFAAEFDSNVRTIRRRIKQLSERGLVKITNRRPLKDGTQQTNLYYPWNGLLLLLREQEMDKALREFFLSERKEEMSEEERIRSCGRPYSEVRPEPEDEEKPGATFGLLVSLKKERLKISYPKKDKGPLLAPDNEEDTPTPPEEVTKKGNLRTEISSNGTNGNDKTLQREEVIRKGILESKEPSDKGLSEIETPLQKEKKPSEFCEAEIEKTLPPTTQPLNSKGQSTTANDLTISKTEPVLGQQWWKPKKKLSEMYTEMRKELRQATLARARSEAYIQKEKEDSIEVVVNEQKAELVYENPNRNGNGQELAAASP